MPKRVVAWQAERAERVGRIEHFSWKSHLELTVCLPQDRVDVGLMLCLSKPIYGSQVPEGGVGRQDHWEMIVVSGGLSHRALALCAV